tara:strand:+ start:275 stop:496 length:222 start_codon:yes stop_codon:yes gene_type:complete
VGRLNQIALRHRLIVGRLNQIAMRHCLIVSRPQGIPLEKPIDVNRADCVEESEGPKTVLLKRSSSIFINGQSK